MVFSVQASIIDGSQGFVFDIVQSEYWFCRERHHDDIKERKIGLFRGIALYPVPLVTSYFPLQETFEILKVEILQVHACMCQGSVWEHKRIDSRCKNTVGGREQECSQVQQPPVTRDRMGIQYPTVFPAKPPAGHYWNLLSSPVELIRLLPVLIPTCPTHHFIVPPPTVEVDWTVSPMLQHRPAASSSLHITEYL